MALERKYLIYFMKKVQSFRKEALGFHVEQKHILASCVHRDYTFELVKATMYIPTVKTCT
jgi:hypothetical protein